MTTALQTISNKLSARFGMGENTAEVLDVLKLTAFKSDQPVNDAQMIALMIVADQYGLNPWTKEIFAFPDKGSIVPVVSVDGWARIINEHPKFDGMDFDSNDESCTCTIYRKDRDHPTRITEYLDECRKPKSPAWSSHPRRMLRHKALIQCARLAFGFVGIYDQDEAERIVEVDVTPTEETAARALPLCNEETFKQEIEKWKPLVQSGKKSAGQLIDFVSLSWELTETQTRLIESWGKANES